MTARPPPIRRDAPTRFAHWRNAACSSPDSAPLWSLASSLAGYDPQAALDDLRVPLLALFGALDSVVPVAGCVARCRRHVRPDLLQVTVVADGDHHVQLDDSEVFAPGYLEALTEFVDARLRRPSYGPT